ncbi:MAG: hypothetical protein LBC39_02620 [Methanobrevibacter sp.]|jgi:hypothetical protein|nr:hypothetical protein [Candidatus Methanovirga aequatorialis]
MNYNKVKITKDYNEANIGLEYKNNRNISGLRINHDSNTGTYSNQFKTLDDDEYENFMNEDINNGITAIINRDDVNAGLLTLTEQKLIILAGGLVNYSGILQYNGSMSGLNEYAPSFTYLNMYPPAYPTISNISTVPGSSFDRVKNSLLILNKLGRMRLSWYFASDFTISPNYPFFFNFTYNRGSL